MDKYKSLNKYLNVSNRYKKHRSIQEELNPSRSSLNRNEKRSEPYRRTSSENRNDARSESMEGKGRLRMHFGSDKFQRNVKYNISNAVDSWQGNFFAPDITVLDELDDNEFIQTYKDSFLGTFQHEMAEVMEHIDLFLEAHGINIFDYYKALEKFRSLEDGQIDSESDKSIKEDSVDPRYL